MSSRPTQITESHLRRKAIAYLRQSSPEQVRENIGSTALQRDLPAMLQAWGWTADQIETVDEDLGVSGSLPGLRQGFAYMVQQIEAGLVGIVAVTDINRLGRNLSDFASFAEASQRRDVLLAHGEQVVAFTDPNGVFLTMILGANAARENHARADLSKRARRKKAESGHASTHPPKGYVAAPGGQWIKDPDPRIRDVISLIFDLFQRLGSAGAVVRALRSRDLKLPGEGRRGMRPWITPMRHEIHRVLKHPAYKGLYIYGQERNDGSVNAKGRRGRVKRPLNEWVVIEGHHEPYVSPELWDQIQERLRNNTPRLRGPLGRGEALVQGIIKCTIHRDGLQTVYATRERQPDGTVKRIASYRCVEGNLSGFYRCCAFMKARLLDSFVERALLTALQPPSIEAIRESARQALREYDAALRLRDDALRRSQQAVDEAERAYDQTRPDQSLLRTRFADRIENALRELEALRASQRLYPLHPPFVLDESELQELRRLLEDLPALWRNASVSAEDRKRVVRTAIRAVHLTPDPQVWRLEIEWVGGARTPVLIYSIKAVRAEVQAALSDGLTIPEIVDRLEEKGFVRRRGPTIGQPYTEHDVEETIRGIRRSRNARRNG
jgi:DNA invertase Pin-like site-specific DNA recombinase